MLPRWGGWHFVWLRKDVFCRILPQSLRDSSLYTREPGDEERGGVFGRSKPLPYGIEKRTFVLSSALHLKELIGRDEDLAGLGAV